MTLNKKTIFTIVLVCVIITLWLFDIPNLDTLFSGLAFVGVVFAILLQSHELELQREMLRKTKEELARSAVAQEQSEIAFRRQLDSMNKTALLHGYSAKLNHHSAELKWHANQGHERDMGAHRDGANEADQKVRDLIQNIEKVMDDYQKESKELP